jgi:hypothetical protein
MVQSGTEMASQIEENYDASKADPDTESFGQDLLKQMDNIPGLSTGTDWGPAYQTAGAAQYAAHQIHNQPINPDKPDSVQILPVPIVIDGVYQNGVDAFTDDGRTTMAPPRGNTSAKHILYPSESPNSDTEREIQSTTQVEFPNDSEVRLEFYDQYKKALEKEGPTPQDIDILNRELGKLVPDLYPPGLKPARPQTQITESAHELLQERTIDNYEGITPYVELNEGFKNNVETDEIGVITAENGSFKVRGIPQDEYDDSEFYVDPV